jgi:hypothetical protein
MAYQSGQGHNQEDNQEYSQGYSYGYNQDDYSQGYNQEGTYYPSFSQGGDWAQAAGQYSQNAYTYAPQEPVADGTYSMQTGDSAY